MTKQKTQTEIQVSLLEIDVQEAQGLQELIGSQYKKLWNRAIQIPEVSNLASCFKWSYHSTNRVFRLYLWVERGSKEDVKQEKWVTATFYP